MNPGDIRAAVDATRISLMVFTNIVMDYIFDDIQNNKNDE
jgi:hypothetical protein